MPDYLNLEEDPATLCRRFELTGIDRPARPDAAHVQDMLIARFARRAMAPGAQQERRSRSRRLLTQRVALARMLLAVQNDTDVSRAWNHYLDLVLPPAAGMPRPSQYAGAGKVITLYPSGPIPTFASESGTRPSKCRDLPDH